MATQRERVARVAILGVEGQVGDPKSSVAEATVLEEDGFLAARGGRKRLGGEKLEGAERSGI